MNNKLFLLCPKSGLETVIQQNTNQSALFLTALDWDFNLSDPSCKEEISYLINSGQVNEVCLVGEEDRKDGLQSKAQRLSGELASQFGVAFKTMVFDKRATNFYHLNTLHEAQLAH